MQKYPSSKLIQIRNDIYLSQEMAQSVKIDFNVWSQFDHHAYDIMTEDFVHENGLKVNANILTPKGKIRLQQAFTKKEGTICTLGESNIWFPLRGEKSFYLQMRNKGFRLHFDNGLFRQNYFLHNLYGSIEPTRKVDDFLLKLGCETIAERWRCNLRYRYSTFDDDHTLYSRWRYDVDNWTFEGIKALRLNDFLLLKNDLLVGYYRDTKTFHLRLENQGWRNEPINMKRITFKSIFDQATFNLTKTLNENSRLGVQAVIKTTGQLKPFSLVFETYDPTYHTTLKLKANSDNSFAFSLRNNMSSYGSYVLGVGVKNITTTNNLSFGLQMDLNL